MVDAKVRRVGTSLGVLIPKWVIEEEHIKEGDTVSVTLSKKLKKQQIERLVAKAVGIAKGAKPFKREYQPDRF